MKYYISFLLLLLGIWAIFAAYYPFNIIAYITPKHAELLVLGIILVVTGAILGKDIFFAE
jgi:hypothetical protein